MTEETMISKKEVLEQTGISYGQFYRWKRMGLIPESWFDRRSTFTGQETFLPKDKILERIERIQALKDDHPLEEVAEMLTPSLQRLSYPVEEVAQMDWISEQARGIYRGLRQSQEPYSPDEIAALAIVDHCLKSGLSVDQALIAASTLKAHPQALKNQAQGLQLSILHYDIYESGSFGVDFGVICIGDCLFDPRIKTVLRIDISRLIENTNIKLGTSAQAYKE